MKKHYDFYYDVLIGAFLGSFGSGIFFLAWLIAPFVGAIFLACQKPSWRSFLLVSLGVFLGGLPIWGIVSLCGLEIYFFLPTWLGVILQLVTTPVLFLIGGVVFEIRTRVRRTLFYAAEMHSAL